MLEVFGAACKRVAPWCWGMAGRRSVTHAPTSLSRGNGDEPKAPVSEAR